MFFGINVFFWKGDYFASCGDQPERLIHVPGHGDNQQEYETSYQACRRQNGSARRRRGSPGAACWCGRGSGAGGGGRAAPGSRRGLCRCRRAHPAPEQAGTGRPGGSWRPAAEAPPAARLCRRWTALRRTPLWGTHPPISTVPVLPAAPLFYSMLSFHFRLQPTIRAGLESKCFVVTCYFQASIRADLGGMLSAGLISSFLI